MKAPARWWPEELGENPDSAGGQNETRYAFFAASHRLAVDLGQGQIEVYDTGSDQISGIRQTGPGKAVFTSRNGEVDLASLPRV